MNMKSFGVFVLAFGVLLIAIGGLRYLANLPPEQPAAQGGYWDQWTNSIMHSSLAMQKADARRAAVGILIPGLIVAFAGVAMIVSAKKPTQDAEAVAVPRMCSSCQRLVANDAAFCASCGNAIPR